MTNQPTTAVGVRRAIAATPDRVYRAWLNPPLMVRSFAPAGFTVRKAEVDERVGGSESEIVELVPCERIVLHWQFVAPDRTTDPAPESQVTVTFNPTPDGTRLDLTHGRLDGPRDRYSHIADQVGAGCECAFDTLVAVGW